MHDARMHGARMHGARMHGARMHDARVHDARMHGAGNLRTYARSPVLRRSPGSDRPSRPGRTACVRRRSR
ncbi:pentapeptide repeat-containing protein [Burkholderia anthina]|uniref:pentapeptide repeat-containing protein n=1 Tax=Burkholderia anthina TaxID=179879 RepID=UPI0018C73676